MITIENLKQLKSLLKILNYSYFSYDGESEISIPSSTLNLRINGNLDLPKGSFHISNTAKCFDFIPFIDSFASFIPDMYFTLSKKEISDIIPFLDKNGTTKSTYSPTQDLYIFAESEKDSFFYATNRFILINGKINAILNKSLESYRILIPQAFIKACKFFNFPYYDFIVSGNYIHLKNDKVIVFSMQLNDATKYPNVKGILPYKLNAENYILCDFDSKYLGKISKETIIKDKKSKERIGVFHALCGNIFLEGDNTHNCSGIYDGISPYESIRFSFNIDYLLTVLKTIGTHDININKSNEGFSIAYTKKYTVLIMPVSIKEE